MSRCDRPLIGIDIGGVLIDDAAGDDEVFFSSGYLAAPEVPGAIDACAELGEWATCFLVSKAGTAKEGRSRSWLFSRQFPRRSGIPPDALVFHCDPLGQGAPGDGAGPCRLRRRPSRGARCDAACCALPGGLRFPAWEP